MNIKHGVSIILMLQILICIIFSTPARPESGQTTVVNIGTSELRVKARTLDGDNKKRVATWSGDVKLTKDKMTIDCAKMELYWKKAEEKANSQTPQGSIDRIVLTGDIKISQPKDESSDEILATAEKAVYYTDDEKVVLTGTPVLKRGDDIMEGLSITLYLDEDGLSNFYVEEPKADLHFNKKGK
jgi:lipopolysaccharide transport protein LptA